MGSTQILILIEGSILCKTHHTSINISICVKPITPRAISISIFTNINRGVMGFTQILILIEV
jgi:hypothetical protein